MIGQSLERVGAGRSLVIDERARILAGNATQAEAVSRGFKLKVVDASRDELVAVRRRDLTDDEKLELALYDNRAAELAEWNPDMLAALAAGGLHLGAFWKDAELRGLLDALDRPADGLTDPDAVPALRDTDIRAGDLFVLGGHRLLCGDSTNADDVRRVMDGQRAMLFATDPPYLVDYDGTNHPNKKGKWENPKKNKDWSEDYRDWDAAEQGAALYEGFVARALELALDERAAWYCWHASRRQAMLEGVWTGAGAFVHQQIIWVKTRATLTRSVYLWQHEPCFFGWLKSKKPYVRQAPFDDGHPTTVWQPRARLEDLPAELPSSVWLVPSTEVESHDHPTSKPVRLFLIPLLMHTSRGDVCYEPFSGSGSQIIAAEQTGRRCFAIEREPRFVQVAVDRWEAFTGQKAQRIPHGPHIPHRKRKRSVS
jgi:DNA modification methylase